MNRAARYADAFVPGCNGLKIPAIDKDGHLF